MKICPNCASLYGDDLYLCPKCNCELNIQGDSFAQSGTSEKGTNGKTMPSSGSSPKQPTHSSSRTRSGGKSTERSAKTSGPRNSGKCGTGSQSRPKQSATDATAFRSADESPFDIPVKRVLSFYEQTWFIVLAFICCWPVGLALIGVRIYRNNAFETSMRNRMRNTDTVRNTNAGRTGSSPSGEAKNSTGGGAKSFETSSNGNSGSVQSAPMPSNLPVIGKKRNIGSGRMTGGIILLILGFAGLLGSNGEASTMVGSAIIFLLPGIILTVQGKTQKDDCLRFEPLIDNRGNTRLDFIASNLHMTKYDVRTRLQKLINKGFLSEPLNGIAAYINGDYELVVMTYNGAPIVPVEETMKQEIANQQAEEKAAKRSAMSATERYHVTMEEILPKITDDEVANILRKIDGKIRNIDMLMGKTSGENLSAGINKNVENMRKKYIPKTIELMERYVKPTTTTEMKSQIKKMFQTLEEAFVNIEEQIVAQDEMGADIEMEILRRSLESDGVLDSDFELDQKGN